MTGTVPSASAALAEILGPDGTLNLAYRLATERAGAHPGPVGRDAIWSPVLQDLQTAVGLVSGLLAGYDQPPAAGDHLGEQLPCRTCAGPTAMRVYGQPWHYTCWLRVGAPVTPAPDDSTDVAEQPATGIPADAPEPATAAPSDTAIDAVPAEQAPAEAGAFARRQRDREDDYVHDPAAELEEFARACRLRAPDATDDECAAALDAWHTHFHVLDDRPFRFARSPGYTGVLLYELLAARHGQMVQPLPLENELALQITGSNKTTRLLSYLNPDVVPAVGMGVTELDVTAQFLGAAPSTECGDGEPSLLDDIADAWLDKLWVSPGYIELGAAPDLSPLSTHAQLGYAGLDTGSWLPTPHAKYLAKDNGVPLTIARALVWPWGDKAKNRPNRYGRRLAVWAKNVRTARDALTAAERAGTPGAGLALKVLKSVYATFLGGMLRSEEHNDKGTVRPDWHDMLVSSAAVNQLRALDKLTGDVTPMGAMKDSVWFLSDTPDAPLRPAGLQYADQPGDHQDKPGKWHLNRFGPVTDALVTQHAAGRVGLVRNAIIATDKARKAEVQ
ncbi:hypothetical protein [Amycolatopsis sp. NBC_01286]|uniref:hypothetical protein n=1 Tax=Amycolatopsis sp. NBC_01286 TaxID=2903560 RepID=UPI002E0DAAB5|nr:hypothetical protein OG570_48090 [Amycolatopsis sp. NBC_01286]